mmetsp:Transcript_63033/g.150177  ORF Transcript_63033/g.150177 Transcript_63033/m.150177 type:complete len:1427 (-) Transcript_63033:108-4388(-)
MAMTAFSISASSRHGGRPRASHAARRAAWLLVLLFGVLGPCGRPGASEVRAWIGAYTQDGDEFSYPGDLSASQSRGATADPHLVPWFLRWELPIWRLVQRFVSGAEPGGVMPSQDPNSGTERLNQALSDVCTVLRRAGLLPGRTDCPEAIVGTAFPLYREMWSAAQGGLPLAEGRPRSIIIVDPKLLRKLSDSELKALLGMELAMLSLPPMLKQQQTKAAWLGASAIRAAFARRAQLKARAAARGNRFWQSKETAPTPPSAVRLGRDVGIGYGVHTTSRLRTVELMKVVDRCAVLTGGSAEVFESALTKAKGYYAVHAQPGIPLRTRSEHAREWALARAGSDLFPRSTLSRLTPPSLPKPSTFARVGLPIMCFLCLGVLCSDLVAPDFASVVVSGCHVLYAMAAVLPTLVSKGNPSSKASTMLQYLQELHTRLSSDAPLSAWMLLLYSLSWILVLWRCFQLRTTNSNFNPSAMMARVLPHQTYLAGAAASLARSAAGARSSPLIDLDSELTARWLSAVRGLSAKLTSLRRLVGASASNSQGNRAQLCQKIMAEIRQTIGVEAAWLRRTMELESEEAVSAALLWWLRDDGHGGVLGLQRPTAMFAEVGTDVSIEHVPLPGLSFAKVSAEVLRAPPPKPESERPNMSWDVPADLLGDQHWHMDALRCALTGASSRKKQPGVNCLGLFCPYLAMSFGSMRKQQEQSIREFLHRCEASTEATYEARRQTAQTTQGWVLAIPLALAAGLLGVILWGTTGGVASQTSLSGERYIFEITAFLFANAVVFCRMHELRLPQPWADLEERLKALAWDRKQLLESVTLASMPAHDRISHLKVLVLLQSVTAVENMHRVALCIEAEASRSAQNLTLPAGANGSKVPPKQAYVFRCLQLLYALIPRHGGFDGQRKIAQDPEILQAMAWLHAIPRKDPEARLDKHDIDPAVLLFNVERILRDGRKDPLYKLRLMLSNPHVQRQMWQFYRLCSNPGQVLGPPDAEGAVAMIVQNLMAPLLFEKRLKPPGAIRMPAVATTPQRPTTPTPTQRSTPPSNTTTPSPTQRLLQDIDFSGLATPDQTSEVSSNRSGLDRVLAARSSSGESSGKYRAKASDSDLQSEESSVIDRIDHHSLDEDDDDMSDTSSLRGQGGHRILAAQSETSDDGSSDSQSSAGFGSFRYTQGGSLWSGSVASSNSSAPPEDMLTHRRPLLEAYASALRPLFLTRGDLLHILAKFPTAVLMGGAAAGTRSYAAHIELLEELFASLVVAVKKSGDRRGKIKLAFGESFTYGKEEYTLGPVQTTLQLTGHGVRRVGQESIPVVYEEDEDEGRSEAAVSMVHEDSVIVGPGALEFEEVVVPLTQVSSHELFLAELMQSDQCQLLASLSQGSHSKYGHRALRRRRRTLRHVREAVQLLARTVPNPEGTVLQSKSDLVVGKSLQR